MFNSEDRQEKGYGEEIIWGDNILDDGLEDLAISPVVRGDRSGTSEITMSVRDRVNSEDNHATFRVTVNDSTVNFKGWNHIKAVGARIGGSPYCEPRRPIVEDRFENQLSSVDEGVCQSFYGGIWRDGKVLDNPKVCSFSEQLCDWGDDTPLKKRRCYGNGSPSNLGVHPLEYNAIYANVLNDNNTECYRSRGSVQLGNTGIYAKAKRAGAIFLEIVHGDTTALELAHTTKEGFFYDLNPAYSYARLSIAPGATYDEIKEALIYRGHANEHDVCTVDEDNLNTYSPRCFLELEIPLVEDRLVNFDAQTHIQAGLYYLGVQDVSYYKGLIIFYLQMNQILNFQCTLKQRSKRQRLLLRKNI